MIYLKSILVCSSLLFLNQCAGPTRTIAPLIDQHGEPVVLTLKNGGAVGSYKESKFIAALEDAQAELNRENKDQTPLTKYPRLAAVPKDQPSEQPLAVRTGLVCSGQHPIVKTKSNEELVVSIPAIVIDSVGVSRENIDAVVPDIQRDFYRFTSHHFRLVPLSALKSSAEVEAAQVKR